MRIALAVDNPYRDLPGLVLTALDLCRYGATCYLIPSRSVREIFLLAPDFVLLNNLRTDKPGLAHRLQHAGIRFGVLDTEGGVFPSLDWYASRLTQDAATRQALCCSCSWGPRLAEYLVREQWLPAAKFRVTGVPRFDFYVHPWRDIAPHLDGAASFPQPLVLWSGSYNLANPAVAREGLERRSRAPGYTPESAALQLGREQVALREAVHLANHLAASLPEIHFVCRPHPFEGLDLYRRQLLAAPNLHLARNGGVAGWILRSCALVQRGCSTAIEAAIAGVPPLCPSWFPPGRHLEAVEAVGIPCRSPAELVEQVRRAALAPGDLPTEVRSAVDAVVSNWFFQVDGLSHQRVARAILDVLDRPSSVSLDECWRILKGAEQAAPWHRRLRASVLRTFDLPPTWSFRRWRDQTQRAPARGFSAAETEALAAGLEPGMRRLHGPGYPGVRVAAADQSDYRFPCTQGVSISVTARRTARPCR